MSLKSLVKATLAALAIAAIPAAAHAAWGNATGSVNLRACASTSCAKLTVIPAGAPVWIGGSQGGWYMVTYNGISGFASAKYIYAGGPQYGKPPIVVQPPFVKPPVVQPPMMIQPWYPKPAWGYSANPWWDPRYGAWYDGSRWYYGGKWYNQPSGVWLTFRFGN